MTVTPAAVQHCDIFRREGQFAGWPANYGMWIWGDEILVVFAVGELGNQGPLHARNVHRPFRPRQARSLDGGSTWAVEDFPGLVPGGDNLSADEHVDRDLRSGPDLKGTLFLDTLSVAIDFMDPETNIMAARTGIHADARSWFYVTHDRGRTWKGPFPFNGLAVSGVAARTDVVPLGKSHALFMLSCAKPNGLEGRAFCAETTDGGRTFRVKSFVDDDGTGYSIMPTSVSMPDGTIITVLRRGLGVGRVGWLEGYRSTDCGLSWHPLGKIVANTGPGGNPASMCRSLSGRIYLFYGVRSNPFGIRCKTSDNQGQTWSEETIIRADGVLPDLGYPRSVLRRDGRIVCAYYFNQGSERFIAASVIAMAAKEWSRGQGTR
ncbi:exo-alpha-sialidase [Rhizobium cauense]|uniref:sialidase family protein n=1 Tax=Rhizobium cauense TaxID=1166683 RepID=UPI001C6EC386|nr:sialidase family protein [Rhizobium cauense]MBW9118127.1 exo-alpha-sialidase [Rhizobium cauense]